MRYESCYIEKMQKLPLEHLKMYQEFMDGKSVMKTNRGCSNPVTPDLKLEQTIQWSNNSTTEIIGQTRKESFITKWETIYYEIPGIENSEKEKFSIMC